MSTPHIILDCLPSLCQKLSDLVEVLRNYNKNNFACFFIETRCITYISRVGITVQQATTNSRGTTRNWCMRSSVKNLINEVGEWIKTWRSTVVDDAEYQWWTEPSTRRISDYSKLRLSNVYDDEHSPIISAQERPQNVAGEAGKSLGMSLSSAVPAWFPVSGHDLRVRSPTGPIQC